MLIVWTGRGYWAMLTLLGVVGIFGLVATQIAGSDAFEERPWLWAVALGLAAVINWFIGRRFNKKSPRVFIEKKTGREFKARHTVFGLPMEYWSVPTALVAAYLLVVGLR